MSRAGERSPASIGARLLLWLCACLLLLGSPAPPAAAATSRAGLVVDYGGGRVEQFCVEFDEGSITGLELLRRAGLSVKLDQFGGLGAGVCKIGDTGCDTPGEPCFCESLAGGSHWNYFHGDDGGGWRASIASPSAFAVRDGAMEGWLWAARGSMAPRSFSAVCPAAQPEPPAPTATVPEIATATPVPPSATPIPPTVTPPPPTATPVAATATATRVPATSTPRPPSATAAPAETATPLPATASPTATAAPPIPTATAVPEATATPTEVRAETPTASATPSSTATSQSTETSTPAASATMQAATAVSTAPAAPPSTPTAVAVLAVTATPGPGRRFSTAIEVPEEQRLAQRVGVCGGVLIALLGMMLWARRRMAQVPAGAAAGEPMAPKMFYKLKRHERPEGSVEQTGAGPAGGEDGR